MQGPVVGDQEHAVHRRPGHMDTPGQGQIGGSNPTVHPVCLHINPRDGRVELLLDGGIARGVVPQNRI